MSSVKVYCVGANLRFPVKVPQHFYAHIIAAHSSRLEYAPFLLQLDDERIF